MAQQESNFGIIERPGRALTAYNFFFKEQRQRLLDEALKQGGKKPSFAGLAKVVSERWKAISAAEKEYYIGLAKEEKARHNQAMSVWRKAKKEYEKAQKAQQNGGSAKKVRKPKSKTPKRSSTQAPEVVSSATNPYFLADHQVSSSHAFQGYANQESIGSDIDLNDFELEDNFDNHEMTSMGSPSTREQQLEEIPAMLDGMKSLQTFDGTSFQW